MTDYPLPLLGTTIDPWYGGVISFTTGLTVELEFPAYSVDQQIRVVTGMTEGLTISSTLQAAGDFFTVVAYDLSNSEVVSFTRQFSITISYESEDVGTIDEDTLSLYYWDEELEQWVEVESIVDTVENTLIATLDHLTTFAVLGETNRIYLPLVIR